MFTSYKHIDVSQLEENLKKEGLLPKELYSDNFAAKILGFDNYMNGASYILCIPKNGEYNSNSIFGITIDYLKKHTSDESIYIDIYW